MTVSSAARNTPSIGLPSQANTPTTITTSWTIASTAASAERPAEPDRQVGQLRQRARPRSAISALWRSSSPRLGADQLVALLGDRRRPRRRGPARSRPPRRWSSRRCAPRCCRSPLSCTTAPGEAGVGDRLAGLVDRQRLARGVLHQPAAGELHAEVEAAADDAGHGAAPARRRRPRASAGGASSGPGCGARARCAPGRVGDAGDRRAALRPPGGHGRPRRAPG